MPVVRRTVTCRCTRRHHGTASYRPQRCTSQCSKGPPRENNRRQGDDDRAEERKKKKDRVSVDDQSIIESERRWRILRHWEHFAPAMLRSEVAYRQVPLAPR